MISDRTLTALAYLAHAELDRHRRDNKPVPLWLRETHHAVACELAARGHENVVTPPEPVTIETVAERARRTGVSKRTVRRYAEQTGGRRVNGAWIFERTTC